MKTDSVSKTNVPKENSFKTLPVVKTRNIRLTVEYDGTAYTGWQKQRESQTIQGTLEDRIQRVCGHPADLLVAGRTDSGVHGLGQTANFHTSSTMPTAKIKNVLNHLLPRDIRIVKAQEVPEAFHATYHAKAKLYRYVIRNTQDHTVFDRNTYHHVRSALNVAAMKQAAKFLIGTHDFTAFRGTLGKWANPKRTITKITIQKKGDEIILEYTGVSFLHQMIRILSGTLLYVGLGKFKSTDIKEILKSKDRKKAGPTLPPNGLFLVKVYYPKNFPKVKRWGESGGGRMKLGFLFYQLGALGVFLTIGIFWNAPMAADLQNGQSNWPTVLILFGFAVATGFVMSFVRPSLVENHSRTLMYVTHALALLSILWLLLWCFVWLGIISAKGDSAEMYIKHMADLHLFGVGFSMAGYASGWLATRLGERSVRFLMTTGWAVSYMAWLNLYLQPGLSWLWAPAVGGLLVVLGGYLMNRSVKPKVETSA